MHVVHREEELAVGEKDVDRGDDVRVMDSGGEPRFVQEHEGEVGLARQVWVCALHRDRSPLPGRIGQAREVHRRHAAGRDLPVDGVATDDPWLGAGFHNQED